MPNVCLIVSVGFFFCVFLTSYQGDSIALADHENEVEGSGCPPAVDILRAAWAGALSTTSELETPSCAWECEGRLCFADGV